MSELSSPMYASKNGRKMLSIERQIQITVGISLTGVLLGAFVNPWFLIIPGFFATGLTFAGLPGTCTLGSGLGKRHGISCDRGQWHKRTKTKAIVALRLRKVT